jgi:hypothetical protein
MTLEAYTEQYRKNLLLLTLKKGRTPTRSGLFWRLLDLMDSYHYNNSTIKNVDPEIHNGYNKVIDVYHGTPETLQEFLLKSESKKVLERQLGEYEIVVKRFSLLIYYKKEAVSWAKLDYDLIEKNNRKYYIRDGFVYRK